MRSELQLCCTGALALTILQRRNRLAASTLRHAQPNTIHSITVTSEGCPATLARIVVLSELAVCELAMTLVYKPLAACADPSVGPYETGCGIRPNSCRALDSHIRGGLPRDNSSMEPYETEAASCPSPWQGDATKLIRKDLFSSTCACLEQQWSYR